MKAPETPNVETGTPEAGSSDVERRVMRLEAEAARLREERDRYLSGLHELRKGLETLGVAYRHVAPHHPEQKGGNTLVRAGLLLIYLHDKCGGSEAA